MWRSACARPSQAAKGRLEMKHWHQPTHLRLSRSGIARLLLAGLLGLSPLSAQGSDWQGVYGVSGIDRARLEQEFTQLPSLGINLVIQNVMFEEDNSDPRYPCWKQYYAAAIRHNISLIPVLWDPRKDQTVWDWSAASGEFELDASRYPNSPAARFLRFLRKDPAYLSHTFAVFSFHEPFNPENGHAQRTVAQQRKLWRQIHQDQFPNGELKLYGESITHVSGCENGCADYAGLGVFSFASCNGKPLYSAIDVVPAPQGVDFSTQLCVTSASEAIQRVKAYLDAMYSRSHDAPPAPDGTFTTFLPLIQTFVAPLPEVSRMPSAAEMRQWAQQIVLARKDRVLGMGWYPWGQVASTYTSWLSKGRFDTIGADRWGAVGKIARNFRKNGSGRHSSAPSASRPDLVVDALERAGGVRAIEFEGAVGRVMEE